MPNSRSFERISVLPFEIKEFSAEERTVWMRASTGTKDRGGEIVTGEAMKEAVDRYMRNPVVTFQHDTNFPVGHAVDADATDTETLLKVYFSDASETSRSTFGFVRDRTLRAMSLGFNPYSRSYGAHPDGSPDYDVKDETLAWRRIDWLETGVVTIPMNQEAIRMFAKGLGLEMAPPEEDAGSAAEREERRFLDDLERYRNGAVSVSNILRHWTKEGRALSPEYIARLTEAHTEVAALLQPHVAEGATGGEGAAPCALTLPQPPERLRLPVL